MPAIEFEFSTLSGSQNGDILSARENGSSEKHLQKPNKYLQYFPFQDKLENERQTFFRKLKSRLPEAMLWQDKELLNWVQAFN